MGAFAWAVVGSVAGVVAAAATIVFELIHLLHRRKQVPQIPAAAEDGSPPAGDGEDTPVVVGEIPQEPLGFQPRADLLSALDVPGLGTRVVVVHAVTGMRGVGKTHLAAAYARTRLVERWRLVAWINAQDAGGVLAGLAAVAAGLGLDAGEGTLRRLAGRCGTGWRSMVNAACWCSITLPTRRRCGHSFQRSGRPG